MRANCCICGDIFLPNIEISATQCGHVFHAHCLSQWFDRKLTCPQCRTACKRKVIRLYFDEAPPDENEGLDPEALKAQLENAKFQEQLKSQEICKLKGEISSLKKVNEGLREEVIKLNDDCTTKGTLIRSLETQLRFLTGLQEKVSTFKRERDHAVQKMRNMEELKLLLAGSDVEAERIISDYGASGSAQAQNLALVCVTYKREVALAADRTRECSKALRHEQIRAKHLEQELRVVRNSQSGLQIKVDLQKSDITRLEEENVTLSKKLKALEAALTSPSGDVANGALRRLLGENVTPNCLKRQLVNDQSSCTPEVVRKTARVDNSSLNTSRDMIEDSLPADASPTTACNSADALLKQYSLNLTVNDPGNSPYLKVKKSCAQPTRATVPANLRNKAPVHNMFSKPKQSSFSHMAVSSSSDPSKCYNGLGGRSRLDDFPRPKPVVIKKRAAPVIGTNKAKNPSGNIADFLKNPFDC